MSEPPVEQDDLEAYKAAAIALVQRCVRLSQLEDLHAGTFPASQTGNYDDVKVVSPYGEIPWNELSRISDAEMKTLMIEIVNTRTHRVDRRARQAWHDRQRQRPRSGSSGGKRPAGLVAPIVIGAGCVLIQMASIVKECALGHSKHRIQRPSWSWSSPSLK